MSRPDPPSPARPLPDAPVTLQVRPAAGPAGQPQVSVIVPLAPGEPDPDGLVAALPARFEVLRVRGGTRASSMNAAAQAARGRFLWFVHADTQLAPDSVQRLCEALEREPAALLFFDLGFDDGAMMRLTEAGVRFRSRRLRLPFGDQALCLAASTFAQLGGYREDVTAGEDHLLVWRAHHSGIRVRPTGARVVTSARKYQHQGWARTTGRHLWLTLCQAAPEAIRLVAAWPWSGFPGRPRRP